eukprot:1188990-Prorocentrum_minimum.AAC.3
MHQQWRKLVRDQKTEAQDVGLLKASTQRRATTREQGEQAGQGGSGFRSSLEELKTTYGARDNQNELREASTSKQMRVKNWLTDSDEDVSFVDKFVNQGRTFKTY